MQETILITPTQTICKMCNTLYDNENNIDETLILPICFICFFKMCKKLGRILVVSS